MIERHTCYYKVNNTPLYRSIIKAINFDNEMKELGVVNRKITELRDGEFEGIFEIDPKFHSNKGFEYFKSRGIEFIMTRASIVEKIESLKNLKNLEKEIKKAKLDLLTVT